MSRRSWKAVLLLSFAFGAWFIPGGLAARTARQSSVSVSVEPASFVQGFYFFRVRISGYAATVKSGTFKNSQEILFVYPIQAKPCARDVYAETRLQKAGQGYQYHVGPGEFSLDLTTFAGSRINGGHVCAYLAPVNFHLENYDGLTLGPLSAKVDQKINVHEAV